MRPRAPAPVEELPLFCPWPEYPPAPREEQRVLPLPRTPEGILAAWRASEEGDRVYLWITKRAVEEVAQGATRLSSKRLLEEARYEFKCHIDNRVTSALARSLIEEHPMLEEFFELRRRSA